MGVLIDFLKEYIIQPKDYFKLLLDEIKTVEYKNTIYGGKLRIDVNDKKIILYAITASINEIVITTVKDNGANIYGNIPKTITNPDGPLGFQINSDLTFKTFLQQLAVILSKVISTGETL